MGGKWTEVLTTDDKKYGGSDIHNGTFKAVKGEYHSRDWSAENHRSGTGSSILEAGTLRKAERYAQFISTIHSNSTYRSGGRR